MKNEILMKELDAMASRAPTKQSRLRYTTQNVRRQQNCGTRTWGCDEGREMAIERILPI